MSYQLVSFFQTFKTSARHFDMYFNYHDWYHIHVTPSIVRKIFLYGTIDFNTSHVLTTIMYVFAINKFDTVFAVLMSLLHHHYSIFLKNIIFCKLGIILAWIVFFKKTTFITMNLTIFYFTPCPANASLLASQLNSFTRLSICILVPIMSNHHKSWR